jgi:hypothetical protein
MTTSNVTEIYLQAAHLATEAAKLSGMSIYALDANKWVLNDQLSYVNKLLAELPRSVVVNSSADAPSSDK